MLKKWKKKNINLELIIIHKRPSVWNFLFVINNIPSIKAIHVDLYFWSEIFYAIIYSLRYMDYTVMIKTGTCSRTYSFGSSQDQLYLILYFDHIWNAVYLSIHQRSL